MMIRDFLVSNGVSLPPFSRTTPLWVDVFPGQKPAIGNRGTYARFFIVSIDIVIYLMQNGYRHQ